MEKDLEYYRNNAKEDYAKTPISVLRYVSELEEAVKHAAIKTKKCECNCKNVFHIDFDVSNGVC